MIPRIFNLNHAVVFSALLALCLQTVNISAAEIEVEEDIHIELTAEQIERAEIGLAQVGPGSVRNVLPLYGVVVTNTEQLQSVSARFDGVILSVNKKIGDSARTGETLLTVESNESLQTYAVVASFQGVITQRNANVGEQTGGRVLFVVQDFSTVWVDLSVFPRDLDKVGLGQSVRISSFDGAVASEGEIIYIAPYGDSSNQVTTVRALIRNTDNRWKPGLFVNAEIALSAADLPLVILSEALQVFEGEMVVFVQGEEGFEPRPVEVGRTDGLFSEVLSGLSINETYVSRNSFTLKSELSKEDAEHGH